MDNARYDLENGPDVVRLNFTHTVMSDTGIWRCDITVRSERYIVSNEMLVLEEQDLIGVPIRHYIQLTVVGECFIANTVHKAEVQCTLHFSAISILSLSGAQLLLVSHTHL